MCVRLDFVRDCVCVRVCVCVFTFIFLAITRAQPKMIVLVRRLPERENKINRRCKRDYFACTIP